MTLTTALFIKENYTHTLCSCFFIPADTMVEAVPGSFYIYAPTQGVPIVFAVLFAASGVLHIWQNNIKYRSWRIGFLLPVRIAYTPPFQV